MWKKTNNLPRWLAAAVLTTWFAPLAQAAETTAFKWPKPVELFQGGLAEVRVIGENLAAVAGRMGQTPIYFYPEGTASFAGLVGADVEAKPGNSKLVLLASTRDGVQRDRIVPVKIKPRAFKTERFNVPPGFDQVSPETLEEIHREQADFARAFAFSSPERVWQAPFVRPVSQEASASSFGMRRVINGAPRAPHSGTDLSVPLGTEVIAANHGRVVLVGNYFFAGGSIVLDHGGGLFTMYFHLSKFMVDQGDLVRRGDVIALSGASGRVTGPHLHWGARLAGARIDPLELLDRVSLEFSGSLSTAYPKEK